MAEDVEKMQSTAVEGEAAEVGTGVMVLWEQENVHRMFGKE